MKDKEFEYDFFNFRSTPLYKELKDQLTPPKNVSVHPIGDHISDFLRDGRGFYESHTFLQFYKDLPKKGTILDIGANIGNHQMMFNQVYPNRRVIGFEASPYNFTHLYNNCLKYPFSTNFCIGLGDSTELVEIVHFASNMGGTGVTEVSTEKNNRIYPMQILTVPLNNFDFLKDELTLVKIDVEGYEMNVIRGADEILKSAKPCIWLEDHNYKNNYDKSCIKFLIEEFEYKVVNQSESNYLLKV